MPADTNLQIEISAVTGALNTGLSQAGSMVRNFVGQTETQLNRVQAAGAGLNNAFNNLFKAFAGAFIIRELYEIASGADKVRGAVDEAALSAMNMGKSFDAEKMTKFIKELSTSAEGGGYALSQLAGGVQKFSAAGADGAQTQYLLSTAIKVAAGTGKDLDTVITAISRAAAGSNVMLSRLGVEGINKATLKTMDLTQVVALLNEKFRDAAELRAARLTSQMTIVANSFAQVADRVRTALIPIMSVLAGWLERLLQWWQRQTPATRDLIVQIGAVVAVASALALILGPLIGILTSFGGAIFAVGGFIGALLPRVMTLATAFGSYLVTGLRAVYAAFMALRTAGFAAATGEAAAAAPIGAIILGMAAVIFVVDELVKHWDQLGNAMSKFFTWEAGALREAVANWKSFGTVLEHEFRAIILAMGGQYGAAFAEMGAALRTAAPMAYANAEIFGFNIVNAIKTKLLDLKKWVTDFFAGGMALVKGPKIPPVSLEGLGIPLASTAGADKAAKAAAKELVDSAKAAADAFVQKFVDAVDAAKARLEERSARVEEYRATLPGGKPETQAQALELQRRIHAEADAERVVRVALGAQIQAEVVAHDRLARLAESLPKWDKERTAHARELNAEAQKHLNASFSITAEYVKMRAEIAKLGADWRDATKAVNEHLAKTADLMAEIQEAAGRTELRIQQERLGRVPTGAGPVETARTEAIRSGLEVQLAELVANLAATNVKIAAQTYGRASPEMLAAERKLTDADDNLQIAEEKAADAATHFAAEAAKARTGFAGLGDFLKNALGDLGQAIKAYSDTIKAGGSPLQGFIAMLFVAGEHTRAFADIQKVAAQIMRVLAQIFEAFRPVIQLVLRVVVLLVNSFITFYNAIASILRLLGIHIALLQKINANFDDLGSSPFWRIVHDIPTLNELATGVIAPLKPDDLGTAVANPIVSDADRNTNVLANILHAILAALLVIAAYEAIKGIMSLFGGILGGLGLAAGGGVLALGSELALGALATAAAAGGANVAGPLGRVRGPAAPSVGVAAIAVDVAPHLAEAIRAGFAEGAGLMARTLAGIAAPRGMAVTQTSHFYGDITSEAETDDIGKRLGEAAVRAMRNRAYMLGRQMI